MSKNIKKILLVILIFASAMLIRFYNFADRINFGPEQAMSLITSAEYITEKPTLLGQRYLRVTRDGHILFASPLFSYSLVPLQLMFNFDPLPITAYFTLLNIITVFLLFLITKKIVNLPTAFFAAVLFIFNNYMIYHSLFIWILNYLPLVGLLSFNFLYQFKEKQKTIYVLLLGLLSGIGIGLEYFYLLTAGLIIFIILFLVKHIRDKIVIGLVYLLGIGLGNLPMVIFDLKHNFYLSRSLWQYTLDTLNNPSQNGVTYYHFLQFWPMMAIFCALILVFLYQINKIVVYNILAAYIILNLTSPLISLNQAVGMAEGLTYSKLDQAARVISYGKPSNFNVATLLDFDSQAHPLRYLVKYRYNLFPEDIENYQNISSLYVLARKDYQFDQALAWEIRAFRPFTIQTLDSIDQKYDLYKLQKN